MGSQKDRYTEQVLASDGVTAHTNTRPCPCGRGTVEHIRETNWDGTHDSYDVVRCQDCNKPSTP